MAGVEGRVALVTGAGRGIGREAARLLADRGARVMAVARSEGELASLGLDYVEVFKDGRWGTICNDQWDNKDAMVVCRQLGYAGGMTQGFGQSGRPPTQIWLDDVQCQGNESDITECDHRPWGLNDCKHVEDAMVTCYNYSA